MLNKLAETAALEMNREVFRRSGDMATASLDRVSLVYKRYGALLSLGMISYEISDANALRAFDIFKQQNPLSVDIYHLADSAMMEIGDVCMFSPKEDEELTISTLVKPVSWLDSMLDSCRELRQDLSMDLRYVDKMACGRFPEDSPYSTIIFGSGSLGFSQVICYGNIDTNGLEGSTCGMWKSHDTVNLQFNERSFRLKRSKDLPVYWIDEVS